MGAPRRAGGFGCRGQQVTADHQARQALRRGLGSLQVPGDPALLQHREAIRYRQHFFELMRDQEHRLAGRP